MRRQGRQGQRPRLCRRRDGGESSTGCVTWPASSGALGVPVFVFHEGNDPIAASAFRQIASLSRGAYLAFDLAGIDRLKELLGAVAVFATGNHAALEAYRARKGGEVLRLTSQLRLTAPTKRG